MESPTPKLLVTLQPSDKVRSALDQILPEVPWAFSESSPRGSWPEVEAMLVGSLTRELGSFDPSTAPNLRFVQRAFTGLDGFPFGKFPSSVSIAGNVGAFGPFVAEHALALALASGRDLARGGAMVKEGRLRPVEDPRIIFGSTAVILGFGAIGTELARRLRSLGARVIGVNRSGTASADCDQIFAASHLRVAVAMGDFVFEIRPLNKRTAGTLGRAELEAMKPRAVLVNVGRAGTVDEEALYRHLQTHPEFRAATDVWWAEDYATGTLSTNFPFTNLPNFSGTPHCAGGGTPSHDIQARALKYSLENVARFFHDGHPLHVVDRQEYDP